MPDDRRLIEDFLPIQAISAEASREKSVRKGHISTLHLWWARRPLVACRAAVYGALVPASRFMPENGPDNKKQSLGRANAVKFIERLCKYPGNPTVIKDAQRHILEAHAERLTEETGKKVTVEDIEEGRAPRPKVLDMFAGGGAIPLEALRLGCEAYALDLNPVAHIIELCTLVYPQKYGKPDPNVRGMTGPKNAKGETTWGGLANEVRYWGEWVLKKVKAEIGDLYPLIPDPEFNKIEKNKSSGTGWGGTGGPPVQKDLFISKRNLPHWELGGSTYFITYRCVPGMTLDESSRTIVMDNWKHWHQKRYLLHAAVVMPDHVHVLITPKEKDRGIWFSLEEILHTNKAFTAHEINKLTNRSGSVWQDERFDRIMRNEEEFIEKWNYIRTNPIKAGLVENVEHYRWRLENPEAWNEDEKNTGGPPVPPTVPPTVPPNSSLDQIPPGYLMPVAYLWTRTVRCKNPSCGATVPLVRQTWLCKKKDRYVALKMIAVSTGGSPVNKKVRFEVVEAVGQAASLSPKKALGFDPSAFSKGGNATCPFCGTVADSDYVKAEGCAKRMSQQMMAIVCTRPGRQGKVYLSADDYAQFVPDDPAIRRRIEELCQKTGLTVPNEPMNTDDPTTVAGRGFGITQWSELFTPRQMLCLLTFAAAVREAVGELERERVESERAKAVVTYLGVLVNRLTDYNSTICHWHNTRELIGNTFGRQALPMVWDFVEPNPFADASGGAEGALDWIVGVAEAQRDTGEPAIVTRGSATALPWPDGSFDAVITDPPYYDNIQYAALSDFFYIWLKRTIGHLHSEHFGTELSPKKNEAVASPWRHKNKNEAKKIYERMMAQAFAEANRVLKPGGQMVVVYAHKTTLGWSTLVDALRRAGFIVTEAWPLNTEMKSRLIAMESAALASSIFLVARKREGGREGREGREGGQGREGGGEGGQASGLSDSRDGCRPSLMSDSRDGCRPSLSGSYEDEVRPELDQIVRERVDSLWKMGITGADLVIAAVGAGLRAFTKFARVEYANGEEVPAEKFLAEVEGVVLETLLEKIFVGQAASLSSTGQRPVPLGNVDGPTRFYILWRYTYGAAEMDAGEAIVFTYGQNVELDGPSGLSSGSRALVEKKKGKYRLRDFTERGHDEKLGMPKEAGGPPAPLIDVLHRILWLVENQPRKLNDFLDEARPDRERLRLVAQTLAGTALEGGSVRVLESDSAGGSTTTKEQAALKKLVANWKALIENPMSRMPLFDKGKPK